MGDPNEFVDIVDDDDTVIDRVPRRVMRERNLLHRSVAIVVVDSLGRLLVHRRALDKDVWPGWWDLAVGGVVSAGESYEVAAVRELAEEVGIHDCLVRWIGRGSYADDRVRARYEAYVAVWDGPVTFDDGEVIEARWVDRSGLSAMLAVESFVPDSLALVVPLLTDCGLASSLGGG